MMEFRYLASMVIAHLLLGLGLWIWGNSIDDIAVIVASSIASAVISPSVASSIASAVISPSVAAKMPFVKLDVESDAESNVESDAESSAESNVASELTPGVVLGSVFGGFLGIASMVSGISSVTLWVVYSAMCFALIGVKSRESLSIFLGFLLGAILGAFLPYVIFGSWLSNVFRVILDLMFGATFGTVSNMVFRIGSGVIPDMVFIALSGLGLGVVLMMNLLLSLISYPFLVLWNTLLYLMDKQHLLDEQPTSRKFSFLRWHSAFWYESQVLPLLGLDKHLILVIEHNLNEGQKALEAISISRHRWAAQTAQVELTIRRLESCTDLEAIRQVHLWLGDNELESPVSELLRRFHSLSEDVNAALNQKSIYNQRLRFRTVSDLVDINLREFNRSSHPYTARFYPIAKHWGEIIINHERELAVATELRQEIDSPYIVGDPLTQKEEIFTGRTKISSRLEQLLLDRRRPPLLLYGQRRMGKTSLLNNLGRLLPNSIIPLFVDLQGHVSSASDHAGLLYNIARSMVKSAQQQSSLTLPTLTREALNSDPFTCFDEWLDAIEQKLEGSIFLLALDEFEALDKALNDKRFDEAAVLGMLRNLIQHRPRFKIMLSGSHTLQEFQRWASYLINVQVVHISYLKESEARKLVEQPVQDFALRYEADAVNRIIELTRSHPFLVQLICEEIVAIKNEQDPSIRRLATLADVEAAIPEAFSSGILFFADLERNQVDENGLSLLRFLAAQGEKAIISNEILAQQFPELDNIIVPLLQRELIEQIDGGYCFQVELIRRWFIK